MKFFGTYLTTKMSSVSDHKIRLIYNCSLFLLVASYLIGLLFDPSWMEEDIALCNLVLDVEGSAGSTYKFGKKMELPENWAYETTRTFDARELRIPSDETDSMFITTWMSPHWQQFRGQFCGDPTKPCAGDKDCRDMHPSPYGEDINLCIEQYCWIRAWCPIQFPRSFRRINGVEDWGVFVKAIVTFPKFQMARQNYDNTEKKVKGVNYFKISDILEEVGTKYKKVQDNGIIILMTISYVCSYHSDECLPNIDFKRVDGGEGFGWTWLIKSPIQLLGNYELPETRNTFGLHGIRLITIINGTVFKFSVTHLLFAIGSLCTLTGSAMAITDFCLLNLHPERDRYVLQKYLFKDDERVYLDVRAQIRKHLVNLGYY